MTSAFLRHIDHARRQAEDLVEALKNPGDMTTFDLAGALGSATLAKQAMIDAFAEHINAIHQEPA